MKRILISILLIIVLIPAFPVKADSPIDIHYIGEQKILPSGDVSTYIGNNQWRAVIGDPKYVPGTNIKIDSSWKSKDGNWISGDNMYSVNISNGKDVNVEYKGLKSKWTPELSIGNSKLASSSATILAQDPLNENYFNNTLMWNYGNGIKRYLRIIEGSLQEYYVVDAPVSGDINIDNNLIKDSGFNYHKNAVAFDANREIIDLGSGNKKHDLKFDKTTTKTKNNKIIQYPITIDPDTTFTTSASDGTLKNNNAIYNTTWTSASASEIFDAVTLAWIGQWLFGDYYIWRSCLYFDTSAIVDNVTITSAILKLYGNADASTTNFDMVVTNGQPTYPHDPLVLADYDKSNYSGNGGSLTTVGFNTTGYNNISLDATGIGWISKTGTTKLTLRSSRDIAGNVPAGDEYILFYTYEFGAGFRPLLVITYTALPPTIVSNSASNVALNTARLNSTIIDDGADDNVSVRFGYGTASRTAANFSGYDTLTSLVSGYDTGEQPYVDITGLSESTTYYYRVQIVNSVATMNSTTEQTFTTTSSLSPPSNFRAIPSDTSISLNWVKGSGSTTTLIRYANDTYPTTNVSGVLLYLDSGSNTIQTGATSGQTYYYSAWGISSGNQSSTYETVAVTTYAPIPSSDDLEVPTSPPGWMQNTDYTKLSGLDPFYTGINNMMDSMEIPKNQGWESLTLILVALISGIIMMTHGFEAGFFSAVAMVVIAGVAQQVPTWMVAFMLLGGLGVWSLSHGKEGQ